MILKIACAYYIDDIIKDVDINFCDILLDEKLYENISVYDISYGTLTGPKPLRIRFYKNDGFIRVLGGEFRYLALFDYGLLGKICDKIKYLVSEKSGITDSINHNKFGSYNSLTLNKYLFTFHDVIILNTSTIIQVHQESVIFVTISIS